MARNFKSSGNIALKGDMAPFFGDSGSASLTEFYRGSGSSALVPNNVLNAGIPTGGTISITDFRNATNEYYAVSVSSGGVDETPPDNEQTFTLTTKNVPQSTAVYYTVSGISSEDIVGNPPLNGSFSAGTSTWGGLTGLSTHAITVTIKADLLSDGDFDSDGYPLPNNETGVVTVYTDSGRGTPIGGDNGTIDWSINDTSLSWYVRVTAPTLKVNGVYTAQAQAQDEQTEGYSGNAYVTVQTPSFGIDGYNAPGNFAITNMALDTSYGSSGRSVSLHPSYPDTTPFMANQNLTAGYGNTLSSSSWAANTDTPSFTISRIANFESNISEGSYGLIIKERFKYDLTQTSGGSKTIESFDCIMQTDHILIVYGAF